MKQKLSFKYLLLTLSGILLLGWVLSLIPNGNNNEVFSQMQMTAKGMTKNNSTAMQTGQQMKGMDMGQMMKMMPPHYSKSTYHLMSSVKGIQISGLEIVNDKELLVKIKSNSSDPVNQNLYISRRRRRFSWFCICKSRME
jgi:hypothetical protein